MNIDEVVENFEMFSGVIVILEYALTHPTANDPERANPSDAGLDVFYSPENETRLLLLSPGASKVIPTGLRFGVPQATCWR